jgi:hypothetical protein
MPGAATSMGVGQMIVYQLINFDREEIIFGTTDIHLEKEVERIAKDPKGPASHWKKGDVVQWRPLTDLIDPAFARQLHKELESKMPPNKYKVIQTYREEEGASGA